MPEEKSRRRYYLFYFALLFIAASLAAVSDGKLEFYTNESAQLYCKFNGSLSQTCNNQSVLLYNQSYKSYGSLTYHNDTGNTISIGDTTNYFNVTGGKPENLYGMTSSNDQLVIGVAGIYQAVWGLGFSGGINDLYEITILVNNAEADACETHRKLGSGGDQGSAASTCLLSLSEGDTVVIGIQNEDSTNDAVVYGGAIVLNKIN